MKKSLLIALFAAMPLMAQDFPQKPECAPQLTEEQKAEMLAKFDADKDGQLSDEERKAARDARKAERKDKFMEKFDADKDGQLSDEERKAARDARKAK